MPDADHADRLAAYASLVRGGIVWDRMGTATRPSARSHIGAEFGLFTPEFFQEPAPVYSRILTEQPVLRLDKGLVLVTRYNDCRRIMRQPQRSRDLARRRTRLIGRSQLMMPLAKRSVVFLDGDDHARVRRRIHEGMSPARLDALRRRVPEIIEDLIAAGERSGQMDVIGDLAFPLVNTVIDDILGIPPEHRPAVDEHAPALTDITEPLNDLRATAAAARGARATQRLLSELVETRRRDPGNDLISALAHSETEDWALTDEEIVANCLHLLNNNEVTVGLIGNGVLALLRHPEQLERFRDDPSIRANAIDELLRYDAPTPFVSRIVGDDDPLEGADLAPGDSFVLAIGAANRDPRKFAQPDQLDIHRPDSKHHLSFANGIRHCPGRGLAEALAMPALSALLERRRGVRLDEEQPRFREQITFRCLEALPVTFDGARA